MAAPRPSSLGLVTLEDARQHRLFSHDVRLVHALDTDKGFEKFCFNFALYSTIKHIVIVPFLPASSAPPLSHPNPDSSAAAEQEYFDHNPVVLQWAVCRPKQDDKGVFYMAKGDCKHLVLMDCNFLSADLSVCSKQFVFYNIKDPEEEANKWTLSDFLDHVKYSHTNQDRESQGQAEAHCKRVWKAHRWNWVQQYGGLKQPYEFISCPIFIEHGPNEACSKSNMRSLPPSVNNTPAIRGQFNAATQSVQQIIRRHLVHMHEYESENAREQAETMITDFKREHPHEPMAR